MKETFGFYPGLSDHKLGITLPIVSIALGAKDIEKHFILDKKIGGADSSFSLEPNEFKLMVDLFREAEKSLGIVVYSMNKKKLNNRILGKSLFVVKDIKAGESFTSENIRSIRPSYGLAPKYYNEILSRNALIDLKRGTPLSWDKVK